MRIIGRSGFKWFLGVLMSLGVISTGAFAEEPGGLGGGLLIEPALTLESGESSIGYPSPLSRSSGTSMGVGLGVRLGLHVSEIIFAGVDARYALLPKFTDSSVNYRAEANALNWGPVVGVQAAKMGLRGWAAFVIGGELNPKASGNYDIKFKDARGFRLGGGLRVQAFSINLEYQELTYGHTILEQLGPFSPGTSFDSADLRNKTWIVSMSFPLQK